MAAFTLLEMLVSAALLLLFMTIAAQLLLEAQRIGRWSVVDDHRAALRFLGAALRRDADRASSVGNSLTGLFGMSWRQDPLSFVGDGGSIRYQLESTSQGLVLARIRSGEELAERRTLLRGVGSWRWRCLSSRLVEIRVTVPVNERERPWTTASRHRRQVVEERHFVLFLRASGKAAGW